MDAMTSTATLGITEGKIEEATTIGTPISDGTARDTVTVRMKKRDRERLRELSEATGLTIVDAISVSLDGLEEIRKYGRPRQLMLDRDAATAESSRIWKRYHEQSKISLDRGVELDRYRNAGFWTRLRRVFRP